MNLIIAATNNGGVVLAPMSILLLGFVLKSIFSSGEPSYTKVSKEKAFETLKREDEDFERKWKAEAERYANAVAWDQREKLRIRLLEIEDRKNNIFKYHPENKNPFGLTICFNYECSRKSHENIQEIMKRSL